MNNDAPQFTFPREEELCVLFPEYRDLALISRVGVSVTYSAFQDKLDRKVIIKLFPKELGKEGACYSPYEKEAQTMARLQHPSLISVYDFGEVNGYPFLSMEYVEGMPLHQTIYGEQIPAEEAARIIVALCEGLSLLHKNGVTHRDISPRNIFLDENNNPKIGVFSISFNIEDLSDYSHLGTLGYIPPEVFARPEVVNQQADIYSVGVILYQMLTGFTPPDFKSGNKLSEELSIFQDIIAKATNHKLSLRYHSIESMLRTIRGRIDKGLHNYKTVPAAILATPITSRPAPEKLKTASAGSTNNGDGRDIKKTISPTLAVIALFFLLCGIVLFLLNRKNKPDLSLSTFPTSSLVDASIHSQKSSLHKLNFTGLPAERTVFINGKPIYLCPVEMTWYNAQAYAESLGGYLSPADSLEKKENMSILLKESAPAWIGMGTVGNNVWQDTYGNKLPRPDTMTRANVGVICSFGSPLAGFSGAERRFFIEWDNKKAFKYNQENELNLLENSTSKNEFPLGTVTNSHSHYLITSRSLLYQEALEYVGEQQVNFLEISDEQEREFLAEHLKKWTGVQRSFWIKGGTLSLTSDEMITSLGVDDTTKIPLIIEWETDKN